MLTYENKPIPEDIDYYKIHNLASEAKQKLTEVKQLFDTTNTEKETLILNYY